MSEETLQQELRHAAKLNNKHRGDVAEMVFMRKASTMGFGVSKPWADSEGYDFVLRSGKALWRVQIKSVRSKSPQRPHYRVALVSRRGILYTADEIDFIAVYIFAEDIWYVFPISAVANRKAICLNPGSRRSPFEQYREAWRLMESPAEAGPTKAAAAAST